MKRHQKRIPASRSLRRLYVLAITLPVVLILIPLVFFSLRQAPLSQAAWFDANWAYRKRVNIPSHSSLESSVYVSVPSFDATDSTKFQADCGDLRFTKENGQLLKFYVVDCDATANIHVLFDSLPAGESNYYMYYGNPTIANGFESADFSSAASGLGSLALQSEESTPGPVAYWKMDEAQGQFIEDSTTKNYDGTLGNSTSANSTDPVWQSKDRCVSESCLYFDAVEDYVNVGDINALEFTGNFSTSLWFKNPGPAGSSHVLVNYGTSNDWLYAIFFHTDETLHCKVYQANSGNTYLEAIVTTNYRDSKWHHLECTVSGTTMTLYIDGVAVATSSSTSGTRDTATAGTLSIGRFNHSSTYLYKGYIDEVKMYGYARTPAQIKMDMASNRAAQLGGNDPTTFLSEGLVGYWKMDELLTAGTSVVDDSGIGNTGTITGTNEGGTADASGGSTTVLVDTDGTLSSVDDMYVGMYLQITATCGGNTINTIRVINDYVGSTKTFTTDAFAATLNSCNYQVVHKTGTARFGNAVWMDGTNDYISVANAASLQLQQFTLAAWVKTTSSGSLQTFISKDNDSNTTRNYWLGLTSGGAYGTDGSIVLFSKVGGVNDGVAVAGTTLVNDGIWHHVAATMDGTRASIFIDGKLESSTTYTGTLYTGTEVVYLGGAPTTHPYKGIIDEARIYNRALSPLAIEQLANWATGPIGYWPMDEGSWTNDCSTATVQEKSGNAYSAIACPNSTGPMGGAEGKFGKAGFFDGVNDYIRSVGTPYTITNGSASVMAWINPSTITPAGVIAGGENGSTYGFGLAQLAGGGLFGNVRNQTQSVLTSCNTSTGILSANTWSHAAVTYEDTLTGVNVRIYLNGVLVKTCAIAGRISSNAAILIGALNSGVSTQFPGKMDDLRVYNYQRTSEQIIEDMNGGHPLAGSPVGSPIAYWALDEVQGTTINSRSSIAFTETLTGTTWKTKTDCKLNGCLDFDGSDDVLTVTNGDAIDFDVTLTQGVTISSWINADSDGENDVGQIFYKGTTTWCRVDSQSGSNLDIECSLDLTGSDATLNVSSPITTGTWNHIALTYTDDSDDEISLWVNGIRKGTSTNGSGSPAITDTANFLVGGTTTANFDGRIDEFKIYSGELSSEEIRVDANANAALNINSTSTAESAQSVDGSGNPPASYLQFDDNTGTTAVDTSSTGNTGTLTSGPVWTQGKIGTGVRLDGTDDFIALPDNSTDSHTVGTVCGWVYYNKPTDDGTQGSFFSVADTGGTVTKHSIYISDTGSDIARLRVHIRQDGTANDAYDYTSADNAIPRLTWTHLCLRQAGSGLGVEMFVNGVKIAVTATDGGAGSLNDWFDDGAASVEAVTIGNIQDNSPDSFLNGSVDEFKLYNYARTDAQIAYDFSRGAPIAHWKLDECQGNTLNDSSGKGNNGTLTVGASGSQTTAGTCTTASTAWGNGSTGKFNGSLNFDGSDDYVSIADTSIFSPDVGEQSVSVWFKTSADYSGGIGYIFSNVGTTTTHRFNIYVNTTNRVACNVGNASGSGTVSPSPLVNDGAWHHFVCTLSYNGSSHEVYMFLDGKTVSGSAGFNGNTITTTGRSKTIGTYAATVGSNNFTGQIDALQIFNYRLSIYHARKLYNNNASLFFGPSSGSP